MRVLMHTIRCVLLLLISTNSCFAADIEHYGLVVNKNGAVPFDLTHRYKTNFHYAIECRVGNKGLLNGLVAFGFLSPMLKARLDDQKEEIRQLCANKQIVTQAVARAYQQKSRNAFMHKVFAAIAQTLRDFQGYSIQEMYAAIQTPRALEVPQERLIAQVRTISSAEDQQHKEGVVVVRNLATDGSVVHAHSMPEAIVSSLICVY